MQINISQEKFTSFVLALFVSYAVLLLPEVALAAPSNPIADVMCNVVDWFDGPVGGAIATLAIIVIGIGALMGKVSWGMAIIVGIGVGVIFGAPAIVKLLGGSDTCS